MAHGLKSPRNGGIICTAGSYLTIITQQGFKPVTFRPLGRQQALNTDHCANHEKGSRLHVVISGRHICDILLHFFLQGGGNR